jgi:hypothetical protein
VAERNRTTDGDAYYISSYSSGGSCVAVRKLPSGEVLVKHSTRPEPRLRFSPTEWAAFLAGVKNGEFDDTSAA